MATDSKLCASCGRVMQWRSKWAKTWESVRYCSDACRRLRGATMEDQKLELAIESLCRACPRGKSVGEDEVAATLANEGIEADRESVRRAARRLTARGVIEFIQQNRVVDPSTARGPTRFRLVDGAKA